LLIINEERFYDDRTFKFLKSAYSCIIFHITVKWEIYMVHIISLHIYFNKDTVFYKILSSWHIHHSWITSPVSSLYLLKKFKCCTMNGLTNHQTYIHHSLLQNYLNFITCGDSQKTMKNDMSEYIKIVKIIFYSFTQDAPLRSLS